MLAFTHAAANDSIDSGEIRFTQAARQGQKAREVRRRIWAQRVELSDAARGVVSATCIVAREFAPPPGVKPIEWRLLSNREVGDFEGAVQLIDWYPALLREPAQGGGAATQ
jgi:hypothetical protein